MLRGTKVRKRKVDHRIGSRWFKGIHWHRTPPRHRKCGNQIDTPMEADSINISIADFVLLFLCLNLILFFSFCVTNAHLHFYDSCCQDAYFPRLEYGNLCVPKWYPKSCFGILSTIGLQHLATTGKGGQAPNALGDCGVPYPWPCSECHCEWLIWLIRGFESFWVDCQVTFEIPLFFDYRSVFLCLMRSRYVNNTRNCFNEALMQDVVSMVRGHRTTPTTVSLDSQYLPSRTLFGSRWGRTFSEPCRHGTRRYVSMSHYFALIINTFTGDLLQKPAYIMLWCALMLNRIHWPSPTRKMFGAKLSGHGSGRLPMGIMGPMWIRLSSCCH